MAVPLSDAPFALGPPDEAFHRALSQLNVGPPLSLPPPEDTDSLHGLDASAKGLDVPDEGTIKRQPSPTGSRGERSRSPSGPEQPDRGASSKEGSGFDVPEERSWRQAVSRNRRVRQRVRPNQDAPGLLATPLQHKGLAPSAAQRPRKHSDWPGLEPHTDGERRLEEINLEEAELEPSPQRKLDLSDTSHDHPHKSSSRPLPLLRQASGFPEDMNDADDADGLGDEEDWEEEMGGADEQSNPDIVWEDNIIDNTSVTSVTQPVVGDKRAILKEGFLKKKSPGFHNSWQTRHCILTGHRFVYFKTRRRQPHKPQNSIALADVRDVRQRDLLEGTKSTDNGFVISVQGRDYVWQGRDRAEVDEWVQAIADATGILIRPSVSRGSSIRKFSEIDMSNVELPDEEGRLEKRTGGVLTQTWQPKDIFLTNVEFRYVNPGTCTSPSRFSVASSSSSGWGCIALEDVEDVRQHELWAGKELDPRGLRMTVQGREFLWRARSKEESERWVEVISQRVAWVRQAPPNYSSLMQCRGTVITSDDEQDLAANEGESSYDRDTQSPSMRTRAADFGWTTQPTHESSLAFHKNAHEFRSTGTSKPPPLSPEMQAVLIEDSYIADTLDTYEICDEHERPSLQFSRGEDAETFQISETPIRGPPRWEGDAPIPDFPVSPGSNHSPQRDMFKFFGDSSANQKPMGPLRLLNPKPLRLKTGRCRRKGAPRMQHRQGSGVGELKQIRETRPAEFVEPSPPQEAPREAPVPPLDMSTVHGDRGKSRRCCPRNCCAKFKASVRNCCAKFKANVKNCLSDIYNNPDPLKFMARWPLVWICLSLGLVAACLVLAWPGIEVDTDFESFLAADNEASMRRDGFLKALKSRNSASRLRRLELAGTLSPDERRRLMIDDVIDVYRLYEVQLFFMHPQGEELTEGHMSLIRSIETQVRGLSSWTKLCENSFEDERPMCDPGHSLVNFIWPTKNTSKPDTSKDFNARPGVEGEKGYIRLELDAKGTDSVPLSAAIEMAQQFHQTDAILPSRYAAGDPVRALRSTYIFNTFCCRMDEPLKQRQEKVRVLDAQYEKFIATELHPLLQAVGAREDIHVYYLGTILDSYDIWETLVGDLMLAVGSAVFIFIYLSIHTQDPVLALGGLVLAFLSIPLAYVTFAAMSGIPKLRAVSLLSLFLIVGIGCDDILVFTDFWTQASHLSTRKRLIWTYRNAGKACAATSFTTAASFFANLASVLRPLREFGVFMGLCVVYSYIVICLAFPAVLVFTSKIKQMTYAYVEACKQACFNCLRNCCMATFPLSPRDSWNDSPRSDGGHHHFNLHHGLAGLAYQGINYMGGADPHLHTHHTDHSIGGESGEGDEFGKSPSGRKPATSPLKRPGALLVEKVLWRFRGKLLFFFICITIIFLVLCFVNLRISTQVPQIFPEGHNQNEAKRVSAMFELLTSPVPPTTGYYCDLGFGINHAPDTCNLNYCEYLKPHEDAPPDGSEQQCSCKAIQIESRCEVQNVPTTNGTHRYEVMSDTVFVGRQQVPDSFWVSGTWKEHVEKRFLEFNQNVNLELDGIFAREFGGILASTRLAPVLQEHWESGDSAAHSVVAGPSLGVTMRASVEQISSLHNKLCGWREICYCGAWPCKMHSAAGVPQFQNLVINVSQKEISEGSMGNARRLHSPQYIGIPTAPQISAFRKPRKLEVEYLDELDLNQNEARTPKEQQAMITVVWGINVESAPPVLGDEGDPKARWNFESDFDARNPRTQRLLLSFCKDVPDELLVVSKMCWVEHFRNWVKETGYIFPVPADSFESFLEIFNRDRLFPNGYIISDFMWLENGRLKGTYVNIKTDVNENRIPAYKALAYKAEWDNYMNKVNSGGPVGARSAWHTSRLWLRAEAEKAIKDSTMATMMISITFGYIGVFVFTGGHFLLALFVVFSVAGVMSFLAFFMVVVCNWEVGAVEVLGLIVFVGYSVTYLLHIVHKYEEAISPLHEEEMHSAGVSVQPSREQAPHSPLGRRDILVERGLLYVGSKEDMARHKRLFAVKYSMGTMSGAILGSAVTTLGSAAFLLGCTMQIFVRLAIVLIAVTCFTLLFTFVVLPTALLLFGPGEQSYYYTASYVCIRLGCCGLDRRRRVLQTLRKRNKRLKAQQSSQSELGGSGAQGFPMGSPASSPQERQQRSLHGSSNFENLTKIGEDEWEEEMVQPPSRHRQFD